MNANRLQRENNILWLLLLVAVVWISYKQAWPQWASGGLEVKTPGPHMLIVRETEDVLPPSQQMIFTSARLFDVLDRYKYDWQTIDDDAALEFADEKWKTAAGIERDGLPWLYIWNGAKGKSCPLPEDVDGVIELLEVYK